MNTIPNFPTLNLSPGVPLTPYHDPGISHSPVLKDMWVLHENPAETLLSPLPKDRMYTHNNEFPWRLGRCLQAIIQVAVRCTCSPQYNVSTGVPHGITH